MKKQEKKNESAVALGRRGGQAKLKKYGKEAFKEMVNKRWEKYREEKAKK